MPRKAKALPEPTVQEAVGLLLQIPEVREAFSPADLTLALEDRGWISPMNGKGGYELNPVKRQEVVAMSRAYWHSDPLAKQAVRVWTDYAVGTGITYKATDAKVNKSLDKFWKYRKNKRLTVSQGQQRLSKQLLIDGDVFFAVFSGGKEKIVRTIDALQIVNIITDPDDDSEKLVYKRIDNATPPVTRYYRDWAADETDAAAVQDPDDKKPITLEEDVVIYHVAFDDLGLRGNGLLSSVVSWSREHRRFMESRVAITQALAKFAWKLTAKGGQAALDAIAKKMQSTVRNGGAVEGNPPPIAGSTHFQNQGADLTPMPRVTGGAEASADSNNLKLMVSAGTNVMLHYFGDPSTGNLATAEAMELPMLKSFTAYQELWKDVWRDLFAIVLEEDIDDEPADIKVDLPQMLKDDLARLGNFLMGLHQVFPEIQVPEILQSCLVALGMNNVEVVMEAIAEKKIEIDKAQEILGKQLPPPVLPNGAKAPKVGATVKETISLPAYISAVNNLAEAIRSL